MCQQRLIYFILRNPFLSGWYLNWYNFITVWGHDDVMTFSVLLVLWKGNPSVTGAFPHKLSVMQNFKVPLVYSWTNGSTNSGTAGDLRRYGVRVTSLSRYFEIFSTWYISKPKQQFKSVCELILFEKLSIVNTKLHIERQKAKPALWLRYT